MNDAEYKKLSLLIRKYCPDFIEEKYPKFIAFLKAYYDWSSNKDGYNPWWVISHLIEWGDIDETLDEFIEYFKSEYLDNLNVEFGGDIREFIKHTKEFYSSRGTPESFTFLIQLLSGNSGTIIYPNRYIMKSSDGEWVEDKVIFIEFNDLIDNSFISTKLRGKYTGATAYIERIETHYNYSQDESFLKVYISNIQGNLIDNVVILNNSEIEIEASLYSTISSINITNGGNNYKPGDNVYIENDPTFMGRISKIKSGKIDSYVILNGGSGYSVGDVVNVKCDSTNYYYGNAKVYVDEVDPSTGAITSLDIHYPGYGFLEVPVVESIESASHDSSGLPDGYTKLAYVENDGTQDIDLGIYLNQGSGVILKFQVLESTTPENTHGLFGAYDSYGFLYNEDLGIFSTTYGSNTQQTFSANNIYDIHTLKREGRRVYLDDAFVFENNPEEFISLRSSTLFSSYTDQDAHMLGKSRLYFCEIYNKFGELVNRYIPAKRDSDSVVGVFDTVNQIFLTKTFGSNPLTAGPEAEDAEIEFIADSAGSIGEIEIINVEKGYVEGTSLIVSSTTGSGAELALSIGKVYTSLPYYYKPGSFLSDVFKLQDSDYYQEYSYEVQSSLTLDSEAILQFSEFKEVFKQLVHPAGFKLFNSFVLSNHINMNMLYVNSTIQKSAAPSFIDLVNYIEMISYWNRIIDSDIIFQHRNTMISEVRDEEIGDYRRTGGEFVHSTIVTS